MKKRHILKAGAMLSLVSLTLCVLVGTTTEVSATAPDTRVRIEPAHQVVGLNETFVVQVVIEEAGDLGAFQFDLAYDSSILQVTEAALGDFLGSTGRSVVPIGPEVNNAERRVTFGAISFGSGSGPSGTGVLATITCIAQGEGSATLGLRQVQVLNTAASVQRVTVDGGQVVVRGAAPPTAAATATPRPTSTPEARATPVPAATALPSPTLMATKPAVETPTKAPSLSPTPGVTGPPVETPATALSPSLTPSIVPTEARPTEVTTPLAVPAEEATPAPTAVTTAPTSPPSTPPLPSPSPLPIPSPTPLATIPVPAAAGPSDGAVLGLMLAALVVAILAVFVLSRRPGG
ncbi:MAG: hypothetical protein FJ014_06880 [Chloroflexi bacterium]|nr:hypothetical protein [Chloroflexota bacterium]